MKILMFSEYFYPHWTGIAQAFGTLALQLTRQGHEVIVVTTQFDKSLKQREIHNAISIIRAPYLFKFSRSYLSPHTLVQTLLHIRKSDVVIINSPHSLILPLSIITKLFRKRLYMFHQGDLTLPRQTGNWLLNRVVETVFDACTIPAFALANQVSTYTHDYAQHSRVMRHFMNKFFTYIPTPPQPLHDKHPSKKVVKLLSSLKKRHTLIGFAGRFVEEKGFDILFEAMSEVIRRLPNAHFVFAGQTHMGYEPFFEKHTHLISQHKEHVTFLGLLDSADLAYFYKSIDLFVIPSRSDCFPLTQMEAALSGVPIVVTDIPGTRMVVKETEVGLIVEPNDPHALAQGIVSFWQSASWRSDQNLDSGRARLAAKRARVTKVKRFLKTYETFRLD